MNLTVAVAVAAPLIADSAKAIATSIGMAVVTVGAGPTLLKDRAARHA